VVFWKGTSGGEDRRGGVGERARGRLVAGERYTSTGNRNEKRGGEKVLDRESGILPGLGERSAKHEKKGTWGY